MQKLKATKNTMQDAKAVGQSLSRRGRLLSWELVMPEEVVSEGESASRDSTSTGGKRLCVSGILL